MPHEVSFPTSWLIAFLLLHACTGLFPAFLPFALRLLTVCSSSDRARHTLMHHIDHSFGVSMLVSQFTCLADVHCVGLPLCYIQELTHHRVILNRLACLARKSGHSRQYAVHPGLRLNGWYRYHTPARRARYQLILLAANALMLILILG